MNCTPTTEEAPLTTKTTLSLLQPKKRYIFTSSEEVKHPWRSPTSPTFDRPLLRIWDHNSGSPLDSQNRMRSRAPRQRIDTAKLRAQSLATHLNNTAWEPTPFISFTSSARAIEDLAELRINRGRGPQTLTVIDPDARLMDGLPVLDVAAEMEHYGIPDPYPRASKFFTDRYHFDHFVCLWEVTGSEVVGSWNWEGLAKTKDWYEEIVMPAFMDFRRGD